MKVPALKVLVLLAMLSMALASVPSAADPSPHQAPDEAQMTAAMASGADWLLSATGADGQLSPPAGSPSWEASSAGRMCTVGLALLRAYQATGTQAYLDRARACGDLALDSLQAGGQYVIDRTGILPTDAGGGFPNAQAGKVDDAFQASYTGVIRFNLWESLRGILFLKSLHLETGESQYVTGATLLDILVGDQFYFEDDPTKGVVEYVTLTDAGTYAQGGVASTTEYGFMLYDISVAGQDLPNLWRDQYSFITYVLNLVQPDGSFDDKNPLPGQTSDSEVQHVLMVPALYALGRPKEARALAEWVVDRQASNGSFECPHDFDEVGDTAWAAMGLLPTGDVAVGGNAVSWLIGAQQVPGSWPRLPSNNPRASRLYSTSWAMEALHMGLTNYNLFVDGTMVETAPIWEGDPARVMGYGVNVTVDNQGLVPVGGAWVRIYDGPRSAKTLEDEKAIDVPALGSVTTQLEFRPAERGPHDVHVWVVYEPGGEFKTRDNNATVHININREPTGVITKPENGQLFPFGASIEFEAGAVEDLDGDTVMFTWEDSIVGVFSSSAHFNHVLPPGDHEVVLTFADGNGPTTWTNVSFSIRHNIAPTIRISTPADGDRYYDYQAVTFDASATSDAEDHDLAFTWASDVQGVLGYGATISKKLQPGDHTITVWADDSWANVSKAVSIKVIRTLPPDVVITAPVEGEAYVTTTRVEFDATDTADPDSEILEFFWTSNIDGLLSERPSFLAQLNVGRHTITLSVTDGNYNVSKVIHIDVLANREPVAAIANPVNEDSFYSSEVVELNGSTSVDMEDTLTYFWVSDRAGYLGEEAVLHVQLTRGEHTITLWINDGHGHNVSTSVTVTILNLGPVAGISAPAPGSSYHTGTNVRFMSATTMDPEGDRLTYEWQVRLEEGSWVPFSTSANAERSFDRAGNYEVKLVVNDGKEAAEATAAFVIDKAPGTNGDDSPGMGAVAAIAGVAVAAVLATVASSRGRR